MSPPETPHLDERTWERLALSELDAAERARALAHVTACARCTRLWKGLLALEAGARAFDPAAPGRPRRATRALWAGGALVLAAAALALWIGLDPSRDAGADDGPAGDETMRGGRDARIEALAPAGRASSPLRFDWRPVREAARYQVLVFHQDGRPVWSGEAAAPPLPGPERLAPGAYYWKVEAIGADGRSAGDSPLTPFTVAP
jgi:hypothetical protein